eukprot:TRINITY_DN12479_c1_g3_i14.p1 TRINITY_DN12479_c1_g3~~TRINITY_DN12479_c1_g3_i14.p1  ORF type:complete len:1447 (+),score=287.09 TRINITY_DN12479_c1_g3_i14:73-4413(+)
MARKKRAAKKPAKKPPPSQTSAEASSTRACNSSSDQTPNIERFATAAISAQLYRAIIGTTSRRDTDGSRPTTGRTKPCEPLEGIEDTRSHIEELFKHDSWHPFQVNYDGKSATVLSMVPVDLIVLELKKWLQAASADSRTPEQQQTGNALPDGIDEHSDLAEIIRYLAPDLRSELAKLGGVYIKFPLPTSGEVVHVKHQDFERFLQQQFDHDVLKDVPFGAINTLNGNPFHRDCFRALSAAFHCMNDLPLSVRMPKRLFDNWCREDAFQLRLGRQDDVVVVFPDLNVDENITKRLSQIEYRASMQLPNQLQHALEELLRQATSTLEPSRLPDDSTDDSTRSWDDLERMFGDLDVRSAEDLERLRLPNLIKTYAQLHNKALAMEKALEVLAFFKSSLRDLGAYEPAATSSTVKHVDEVSVLPTRDLHQLSDDDIRELSADGLQEVYDGIHCILERSSCILSQLRNTSSRFMNRCDVQMERLKTTVEHQRTHYKARNTQRLDVENRIFKAGDKANKKQVARAQIQIAAMEEEEAHLLREIEDNDNHHEALGACKRWLVDDTTILHPMEKAIDDALASKFNNFKGKQARLPSLSSPVMATSITPTPELIFEGRAQCKRVYEYIDGLWNRMREAGVKYRKLRSQYFEKIVENVDKINPVQQCITRAAVNQMQGWYTRAVQLTKEQLIRDAEEREESFKQLIGQLDNQAEAKQAKAKRKQQAQREDKALKSTPEDTSDSMQPNGDTADDNDRDVSISSPSGSDIQTESIVNDGGVVATSINPNQAAIQEAIEGSDDDSRAWQEAGITRKKKSKDKRPNADKAKPDKGKAGKAKADKSKARIDRADKRKQMPKDKRAEKAVKAPQPSNTNKSGSSSSTPPSANSNTGTKSPPSVDGSKQRSDAATSMPADESARQLEFPSLETTMGRASKQNGIAPAVQTNGSVHVSDNGHQANAQPVVTMAATVAASIVAAANVSAGSNPAVAQASKPEKPSPPSQQVQSTAVKVDVDVPIPANLVSTTPSGDLSAGLSTRTPISTSASTSVSEPLRAAPGSTMPADALVGAVIFRQSRHQPSLPDTDVPSFSFIAPDTSTPTSEPTPPNTSETQLTAPDQVSATPSAAAQAQEASSASKSDDSPIEKDLPASKKLPGSQPQVVQSEIQGVPQQQQQQQQQQPLPATSEDSAAQPPVSAPPPGFQTQGYGPAGPAGPLPGGMPYAGGPFHQPYGMGPPYMNPHMFMPPAPAPNGQMHPPRAPTDSGPPPPADLRQGQPGPSPASASERGSETSDPAGTGSASSAAINMKNMNAEAPEFFPTADDYRAPLPPIIQPVPNVPFYPGRGYAFNPYSLPPYPQGMHPAEMHSMGDQAQHPYFQQQQYHQHPQQQYPIDMYQNNFAQNLHPSEFSQSRGRGRGRGGNKRRGSGRGRGSDYNHGRGNSHSRGGQAGAKARSPPKTKQ